MALSSEKNIVHSGELNRIVKFYNSTFEKQGTNEVVPTNVLIAKKFTKRIEISGSENDKEGKVRSQSDVKFIVRFSKDILKKGTEYFIRDIDGDYYINSVQIIGRNRFLECKAQRRDAGE